VYYTKQNIMETFELITHLYSQTTAYWNCTV